MFVDEWPFEVQAKELIASEYPNSGSSILPFSFFCINYI